jgi:hypothetical protein
VQRNKELVPLYSQRGVLRPLIGVSQAFFFLALILVSVSLIIGEIIGVSMLAFASIAGLIVGFVALPFLLGLIFAKDLAFYSNFIEITSLNGIEKVPYWQVQYCIVYSHNFGKQIKTGSSCLRLKIRDSGRVLNVRENPYSEEIGTTLRVFLRKRTSSMIVFG